MRRSALAGAWLLAGLSAAQAADPDALWKIVHDRCAPDQQAHGDPAPCEAVALTEGYAILKDQRGATQFLLIPTAKITGIESAAVLAADAPNYFRLAWAARKLVSARAGHALPDADISLAINAVSGRTQNQLHIHIDCVRADVRDYLSAHGEQIGPRWTGLAAPLARYHAMRLADSELTQNPFDLLAASLADPAKEMGAHTLVMVALPTGGLVLLDDAADLAAGDRGSGEELQDHQCAVANLIEGKSNATADERK